MTEQAPNVASSLRSVEDEPLPTQTGAAAPPWWAVWAAMLALAGLGTWITGALRPGQIPGLFIPVLAFLICLVAAGFDAATAHIPNPLTYTAILAGLALNTAAGLLAIWGYPSPGDWLGAVGIRPMFFGFALCAGIGIVCLTVAGMGGGDVKLLVALGALLGFSQVSYVLLLALLIAVPYGLVNLVIRGRLNGVLRAIAAQMLQIVYFRRLDPVSPPSRTSVPMAVPVLVALFCTRVLPHEWLAYWIG